MFHLFHDCRLLKEVAQLHRVLLQQHHMLTYPHILILSNPHILILSNPHIFRSSLVGVREICKEGCEGGGGERVEYVEGEMDEGEGGVWVYEEEEEEGVTGEENRFITA